ncbi:hypothetical protein [Granulicella mallensis]|uniref:Uncharacterized protein n=1 Tax=Granulicella mallensis (strain ATCC BAA-1857 / DSM 23137 / MP5ACTX8) TaxID=682795 RepID=G8NT13_GRAMM|nr:hypothetical protein [Granulicella mallensis]AEU37443.1 hypothetical protein AciX8_3140 [Granulicella mallensis MP5ACTX8]
MKGILKFAFVACLAVVAGSASAKAQTVVLDGLGSSGLFLELGLGANSSAGTLHAACVWSENTNTAIATDTSLSTTTPGIDKGSAFVAWTKGSDGTCATAGNIYAYESTDSVVGNRCLYNSNLAGGSKCSISYATAPTAPVGLILTGGVANCGTTGECPLPASVVSALDSSTQLVNFAGTDIRPEDAKFATTRALTNCGTVVGSSTQYLGLGYAAGSHILTGVANSTSFFNVLDFTLPAVFVTPVGATPIIVAVNDASGTGLRSFSTIGSQALANFLDGTSSVTGQVSSPTGTGSGVTVFIREPLSGTYNTMEFNAPNRVGTLNGTFATSQDVGLNQPAAQVNCTLTKANSATWPIPAPAPGAALTSTVLKNPLDFTTPGTGGTGSRIRAIGTGQELSSVVGNTSNSLGYGFWSAANFAGFSAVSTTAKYYSVDGIDPLGASGTIPTTSAQLANVSLTTTADGKYPIWSMLRLVNVGTTQNANVAALSSAAQAFSVAAHPDFVPLTNMLVVRSHFAPPAQTLTAADGSGSTAFGTNAATACTLPENGGDVGGVVIGLKTNSLSQSPLTVSDNSFCTSTNVTGQTGHRR